MTVFKKIYYIFAVLFFVSCCQRKDEQKDSTLIVGVQSGYPPFEYVDEEGIIVGFDIQVAKLIAQALHKDLVIKDMDFDGEILALKQEKIDLIMSGMNITESRLKEIAMVPYHGDKISSLCLLFWGKIPKEISSFQDLIATHAAISVESGGNAEVFLSKYKGIQIKSFDGSLASLMDVKFGKSLAQLVEPDVAKYLMNVHEEISCLEVPLPEDEVILGFGIGVRKENKELFQAVEKIILKLKETEQLSQLENVWFHEVGHDN